MKKLLCALLVTAMAPLAYGQSTAPAAASDAAATAPATAPDKSALAPAPSSDAAKKTALAERNCVRETGSLIVRHDKCVNAMGQSYDDTAIGRTGTYDTPTALERLSPQIQIRPAR